MKTSLHNRVAVVKNDTSCFAINGIDYTVMHDEERGVVIESNDTPSEEVIDTILNEFGVVTAKVNANNYLSGDYLEDETLWESILGSLPYIAGIIVVGLLIVFVIIALR